MKPGLIILTLFALAPLANAEVTYSKEISRLFQAKCQGCHRSGDIAPFALDSYEAAKTWGEDIQRVVREKVMPPWKPVDAQGKFKNDFGLTDEDRRTILDWYKADAPEGDPAELPEPAADTGEWQLGEPDAVIRMPEIYDVPRRKDIYRCFVAPTGFDEDVWLKSVQVAPGNRQVVHHVILYLDETGRSVELDAKDEEPGYECFGGPGDGIQIGPGTMLGGWVPGSRVGLLPEGVGLLVPKGARVIIQMHYFPAGRQHSDQTKVGLYVAKSSEKMSKRMVYLPLLNTRFRIPVGENDYEVSASAPTLPADVYMVVPHMHLLGKKIQVTKSNLFTRATETLIKIDDWDFNWQGFYSFVNPVRLGMLEQLRLSCRFDNSTGNPRNPSNPLKPVQWGEGTEDEMCVAFLGLTFDNQDLLDLIKFQKHNQRR
ncbi:MAG: ascorbate-dependent monooxygenase [Bryobacteraceae bacterium]